MRIALGCDHGGFPLKQRVLSDVQTAGHSIVDCGTDSTCAVDYPDYALKVGEIILAGGADRGILLCGSGVGISVAANKIPGIRAGRPTAEYLDYVLTRVTLPGSLYLGIISLIPLIALVLVGANQNFPFGGASLLIMVGVGLETVKQIDSQLQQRHYEGLLR